MSRKHSTHVSKGKESLEVLCFRDGSLDVCLTTGKAFYFKHGKRVERSLRLDKDGYLHFDLNRERSCKRGRPSTERSHGKTINRWRDRRFVRVNRAVKIKAIAVGLGGDNWRKYVKDLPRGVDVNHIDRVRHHNWSDNLELQTERANRGGSEMTEKELAGIRAFNGGAE